jgi:pimeloyl-ACP methyl ester carboxylesterase
MSIGVKSYSPRPFSIAVPDATLEDLKRRLSHVRWPDEVEPGWAYGVDLKYLRSFVDYWRDEYDWRKNEAALNELTQFTVEIDSIDLHYVHVGGQGPDPMPLLLTHGWPSSFADFRGIIPMLTDPARFGGDPSDAFTVVAPSIPGHGFSFKPNQRRFSIPEISDTFAKLMVDVLGYRTFGSQGGDWGAFVSSRLAYAYPRNVRGIQISLLTIPRERPAGDNPTHEENLYFEQLADWLKEETGYIQIMGTKPQTLAYALSDSPVGLAAWILEKFRSWTDCDGNADAWLGRDVLATNVMLYWATGAIGSSFWPYYARHRGPWIVPPGERIQVPCGYAEFPKEFLRPPRSLAERMYGNITRWTKMERGGHFPALEQPEELAKEIRAFFRTLR